MAYNIYYYYYKNRVKIYVLVFGSHHSISQNSEYR